MSLCSLSNAQSTDSTLDVVNWNIEWFGSTQNGPANKNVQEQNTIKILRYLDADIYALCEIVDTARFRRVVDSLGSNYGYVISDYCSLAAFTGDADWLTGQKLAFIYKKSLFSNIQAKGMLRNSAGAYTNFASGRFPFLFNANVTLKGKKRNISFIVMHAKSGATYADYNKRLASSQELKDSIGLYYNNVPLILLGDFNDDLDESIVTPFPSPFKNFVDDSTSAKYFRCITYPLTRSGLHSTIGYSDMIDHQVINYKMDTMYIKGSVMLRTDVTTVVPDYTTRNTSDHYPVFSRYNLVNGDTSAVVINPAPPPPVPPAFTGLKVYPAPFTDQLFIRSGETLNNVTLELVNMMGQSLWKSSQPIIPAQAIFDISVPASLPHGIYLLRLNSGSINKTFKLIK